ncbi:type II asparaginase [Chitinophaga nivalis]|uniref:Type II asparaginase n=2 Tax=Chitinophaga nivalis TaxID=2991709 RepID=A0ABT3IQK4_9BACT|nr:type II asparaginase [Chitinophaga nivalis]MCW3464087.1 type II asparaginase [Chitinophaga nivalis]MCW3486223.1 type II asparaginase [Chitinophaga nivalis]
MRVFVYSLLLCCISTAVLQLCSLETVAQHKRKKGNIAQTRDNNLPNIVVLATGGTIAGAGTSSVSAGYTSGKVPVNQLLNAVPEAKKLANLSGEQIASVGSQAMADSIWLKLAKRVNQLCAREEVDGIVITHGTDTESETAYFLQLTVKSIKPVVVVGAMRSATAISADGPKNLYDAIAVAATRSSANRGVLIAMNEQIFSAREATKTNTTSTATFQSPNAGPLGVVYDGKVSWYHSILRKHTIDTEFDISQVTALPKVDILYGYANMDASLVDCLLSAGTKGIVIAGVGNGNLYPTVAVKVREATSKGIPVVRASRTASGRVTLQGETDDRQLGTVVSDDLDPSKARVLLQLALLKTNNTAIIQDMFFRY